MLFSDNFTTMVSEEMEKDFFKNFKAKLSKQSMDVFYK
jgi:hypothetical protein